MCQLKRCIRSSGRTVLISSYKKTRQMKRQTTTIGQNNSTCIKKKVRFQEKLVVQSYDSTLSNDDIYQSWNTVGDNHAIRLAISSDLISYRSQTQHTGQVQQQQPSSDDVCIRGIEQYVSPSFAKEKHQRRSLHRRIVILKHQIQQVHRNRSRNVMDGTIKYPLSKTTPSNGIHNFITSTSTTTTTRTCTTVTPATAICTNTKCTTNNRCTYLTYVSNFQQKCMSCNTIFWCCSPPTPMNTTRKVVHNRTNMSISLSSPAMFTTSTPATVVRHPTSTSTNRVTMSEQRALADAVRLVQETAVAELAYVQFETEKAHVLGLYDALEASKIHSSSE